MFICAQPPQEEVFPPNLEGLGFKYENGQFLTIEEPHAHFEFFYSDNEKVNERRKEAFHEAIRQTVAHELQKFGIKELYLGGESGTDVFQHKPEGAHVRLLATEVSELRRKKDVIIVVGESGGSLQDAGIWAYRIVAREGGTENGSAVGLAARIAAYGQAVRDDDPADEFERVVVGTQNVSLAEIDDTKSDTTPGLVILNPGQLLYSHKEKKPMSMPTWLSRDGQTTIDQPYSISEKYNRVPGHQNQTQHIMTCFEYVLPYILREDARVYLAVVGDSAKDTIDYLDQFFLNKSETGLAQQLEAVAIVQGNEVPEDICSEKLKIFLAANGKKWIESSTLPYGRLVQTPGTGKIVDINDFAFVPPQQSIEDVTNTQQTDYDADTDSVISTRPKDNDEQDNSTVDAKDEAYEEYAKIEVLCPTFSAGDCDNIVENVFPKVMTDVLNLFWEKKEKAEQMDAIREARGLAPRRQAQIEANGSAWQAPAA